MNRPAEGEGDHERAARGGQEQHDREVDRVDEEDRRAELALRHPARQDRMRGVEGADVVVRVDAALEVEVVVDHVVRRVGDDEPDHRQHEVQPVDSTVPVSRAAPTASSAPISPDVAVIEKTAARVMTSHLLTASGWVIPSGRFAVFRT